MDLNISRALLSPGEEFPFEAKVTVPPQDVTSDIVSFDEVFLSGTYSAMDGVVKLTGNLSSIAHAPCAMCLEDAEFPIDIEFSETFREDAVETEDEAFRYEGSKVSLDHLSLTLLLLNLPMRFLCKEGCSGNQAYQDTMTKSSCEEEVQRPFEALKRLLEEDEEV